MSKGLRLRTRRNSHHCYRKPHGGCDLFVTTSPCLRQEKLHLAVEGFPRERGDPALCDVLISYWMLYCALFEQAPLPDLFGLAQRINALPTDHRSSTYAVRADRLSRDAHFC